jgi:16S rRNA (cytosine967-C5)-methyltransferase
MAGRDLALKVLAGVERDRAHYDDLFDREAARRPLKPEDRALAMELVAGVLRHRARLDWILDSRLRKGTRSLGVWAVNNLRMGAYQLLYLDRVPHHAVVDEAVKLAKRFCHKGMIGLTNAVLRDIIKSSFSPSEVTTGDAVRDLAIRFSHPEWLVRRWLAELGPAEARSLLEANNRQAPATIRANPLKTTRDELLRALSSEGYEPRPHPLLPGAIEIDRSLRLADLELFTRGHFYFQDASSQAACALFAARPGMAVLDLCAAPGGKCSAALEQMAGRGLLVAVDRSHLKLKRVRQNLERLGLRGGRLACGDATDCAWSRRFDLVLVDAPCTGLGVLRRRLDLRWRIEPEDIVRMADLQHRILDNAAHLVAPGGALVYSTCTLMSEENRLQVSAFLERHPEFAVEPAERYLPRELASDGYLQTWPQRHAMDGAFGARMVKSTARIPSVGALRSQNNHGDDHIFEGYCHADL